MPRPSPQRPPRAAAPRSRPERQFRPAAPARAVAQAMTVGNVPDKFRKAVDQFFNVMGGMPAIMAEAASARSVFSKANIVGAGIGFKETGGETTGTMAVQVFVVKKLPAGSLDPSVQVPATVEVDGEQVPTDVIETGEIVPMPVAAAQFTDVIHAQAVGVYTGRYRPAGAGASVGHPKVTAGTLGCLVARNDGLYLLSNNHVLGAVNTARPGDLILQPGKVDGGTSADAIGTIDDAGDIILLKFGPNDINTVDATLALTNDQDTTPTMQDGTTIDDPTFLDAFVGMRVHKVGRTTGATEGVVRSISARIRCNYENGRSAQFVNQIMIQSPDGSPFSQGGDSGSLITSIDPVQPVALLFSGTDQQTFACPIKAVSDAFGGFDVLAVFDGGG